jgi:hypothetical protein
MAVGAAPFLAGWAAGGKLLAGAFAVVGTIRYGAGLHFWRVTERLERPTYRVIRTLSDGVELRRYEPYLIAETTVEGTGFREPSRDGFRTCAGYIFGKNKSRNNSKSRREEEEKSEKMAMTAPVRVEGYQSSEKMAMTAPVRVTGGVGRSSPKKTKVSFVIGSKYTLKTAPKPIDRNVTLRQVPTHVLAVRTFSGPPPTDERVELERQRVERALAEADLKPAADGETFVYGYHDPFITPNFLRRNEVAVRVKGA